MEGKIHTSSMRLDTSGIQHHSHHNHNSHTINPSPLSSILLGLRLHCTEHATKIIKHKLRVLLYSSAKAQGVGETNAIMFMLLIALVLQGSRHLYNSMRIPLEEEVCEYACYEISKRKRK
ncbi:hypothetical protein MANES_04G020551v8 [Manihot esculenta]|uniref:Uncharacterized protein n=1 Tax=Manihot esculenta TaxID=3983 RepID=A0ACB7HRW2_MANES|nr:hypothetical protein MANES_04G020551v8 [Manihot esculenta]